MNERTQPQFLRVRFSTLFPGSGRGKGVVCSHDRKPRPALRLCVAYPQRSISCSGINSRPALYSVHTQLFCHPGMAKSACSSANILSVASKCCALPPSYTVRRYCLRHAARRNSLIFVSLPIVPPQLFVPPHV